MRFHHGRGDAGLASPLPDDVFVALQLPTVHDAEGAVDRGWNAHSLSPCRTREKVFEVVINKDEWDVVHDARHRSMFASLPLSNKEAMMFQGISPDGSIVLAEVSSQ
jgi:hypothetical protein